MKPTSKQPHFSTIDFSNIPGGASIAVERIPAEPGVYAFFRQLEISHQHDPEGFTEEVLALIGQPAANSHATRCGPLHNINLHSHSTLSQKKENELRQLAADDSSRQYLANVISACTMLQSPLYVGKADRLRRRIGNHLDPSSDLSLRLREVGICIEKCVLVYTLLDDDVCLSEASLFLFEEIISRICRPGFVLRIG